MKIGLKGFFSLGRNALRYFCVSVCTGAMWAKYTKNYIDNFVSYKTFVSTFALIDWFLRPLWRLTQTDWKKYHFFSFNVGPHWCSCNNYKFSILALTSEYIYILMYVREYSRNFLKMLKFWFFLLLLKSVHIHGACVVKKQKKKSESIDFVCLFVWHFGLQFFTKMNWSTQNFCTLLSYSCFFSILKMVFL